MQVCVQPSTFNKNVFKKLICKTQIIYQTLKKKVSSEEEKKKKKAGGKQQLCRPSRTVVCRAAGWAVPQVPVMPHGRCLSLRLWGTRLSPRLSYMGESGVAPSRQPCPVCAAGHPSGWDPVVTGDVQRMLYQCGCRHWVSPPSLPHLTLAVLPPAHTEQRMVRMKGTVPGLSDLCQAEGVSWAGCWVYGTLRAAAGSWTAWP